MTHLIARFLTIVAAFALITTAFAGATAFAAEDQDGSGAVYTQTNAASGNAVLAFRRADDGTLVKLLPRDLDKETVPVLVEDLYELAQESGQPNLYLDLGEIRLAV